MSFVCKLYDGILVLHFFYFWNLFKFLDVFFHIPYINTYLILIYLTISYTQRHLQGTSYRNGLMPSKKIVFLTRGSFILFLSRIIIYVIPQTFYIPFYYILVLYSQFYFDGSENSYIYLRDFNSPIRAFLSKLFSQIRCRIINDGEEPIIDQVIFGLHPHGLFPIGQICNLTLYQCGKKEISQIYPRIKKNEFVSIAASFCFYIPFMRELMLLLGIMDCSRPNVERALRDKKTIGLFIGGAEESIYSGIGRADLIIRKRRGIFELAIENGISLVPTYTFGENNLFTSYKIEICGIFSFLQRCTGVSWPRGVVQNFTIPEFITIIGKPIKVEQKERNEYTDIEINELREKYIVNLKDLFNRYKYLDETCKNTEMRIMA